MRIAALYDIHGNIDALNAVLDDPAAAAVDAVLVGGDVVAGRFGLAAMDRLAGLDVPTHWVRGDGERKVAAAVGAGDPDPGDMLALTAAASAAELGADRARPLADLPTTVELDGVVYCHASPRSDDELLTRTADRARYDAALGGVTAATVVAGHTHQQDDRRVGPVRFVNAGSVGLPYEGDGAARWLLVVDGEPTPRRTEYDSRAAGERILAAGWPDVEGTSGSLIDPAPADVVTQVLEQRYPTPPSPRDEPSD